MERTSRLRIFYRSYKQEIRFFCFLILYFILGQAFYYFIYPNFSESIIHKLNAQVCSRTINTITPSEETVVEGTIVRSDKLRIQIVQGCDGTEGMILLVAAIMASPAGILRRVIGSLAGCVAIYLFNIIRITGLYYLLKYKPAVFDISHVYVGQIFGILVAFIFFLLWLTKFSGINGNSEQKA